MFSAFEFKSIPLQDIQLDERNPRIVTQTRLSTQNEILAYLYEHEDIDNFVRKIANEGKNFGAERPYVIRKGTEYVVVEGNSRIAAYKILSGLMKPPSSYSTPHISDNAKEDLKTIDCSIAPDRETLMPIVARAHFGLGDKSRWGYLGSRKALYDDWKAGTSIPKLARSFGIPEAGVREFIVEYLLYLKALSLNWSTQDKAALLDPAVAFNPPVRFLQTSGHKEKLGITLDTAKLKVVLHGGEAQKRFKHLVKKLVVSPQKGLGATANYDDVFADYAGVRSTGKPASGNAGSKGAGKSTKKTSGKAKPKVGALFTYAATLNNALIKQLMIEAKDINGIKLPAAGTFLLRNIIEAILKEIIHTQKANPSGRSLDLVGAIQLCLNNNIRLDVNDKRVLKEFLKHHVNYLNLGAHANVIPNKDRLMGARDCIDQFVKRNV